MLIALPTVGVAGALSVVVDQRLLRRKSLAAIVAIVAPLLMLSEGFGG